MNLASSEWSICIVLFLGARYYYHLWGFKLKTGQCHNII